MQKKDYTKAQVKQFKEQLSGHLENIYHTTYERATNEELYKSIAAIVGARMQQMRWKWNKVRRQAEREQEGKKKIYYISMEFLMGQSLKNNLYNLNLGGLVEAAIADRGVSLEDLYECEPDAGLGNGGLGRLAACYLDGLVAQNYDITGFSIRYEYGLFKQKIVDGWQVEMPDNWLPGGHVWLRERREDSFRVSFYGDYNEEWVNGKMKPVVYNAQTVEAVPYDMLISGAGTDAIGKLRLWRSINSEGFDMASFNSGDFTKAQQNSNRAELISKVLYPADNIEEGKELRLKQQYFMVSASCQNILRDHYNRYGTVANLADKVSIQINDTHPALCIPELMRLLMDDYGFSWERAWKIVYKTVGYTNHTILAEALEKWNSQLVRMLMPRVYVIIEEIDRRFREDMNKKFPGDWGKINYMAPIGDNQVRMANLSVIGSHMVNGVSGLHSEILKDELFHDFYLAWPKNFTNVTNGIAYRRWLCQSNPGLTSLLKECIGDGFLHDASELEKFEAFKDDAGVQKRLEEIKRANKAALSDRVYKQTGVRLNPDGVFDVQAKRLHEYKRQLLNVIRIITRYQYLRDNPNADINPEVYLFAAKSAPSYFHAKEVIQLISKLGEEINSDPVISKKLQVLFLENYSVSMAEHLMPATEISEQISLAGKEASGTGNMKMMINGAITIGTEDGANVEMHAAVGDDNIFIFGQRTEEVKENVKHYESRWSYESNSLLRAAVDALNPGFAGKSFRDIYNYLLRPTYSIADPYMCMADFDDYCRVHQEMMYAYADRPRWNSMSIVNISKAGIFSADRAVKEYADRIWHTKPII